MFEALHKVDPFGTLIIDSFHTEGNDFLSNFYDAPITLWGMNFPTSEHAYQWKKTNDQFEQDRILFVLRDVGNQLIRIPTTPGQAKRMGANCTRRDDWTDIKNSVMLEVLTAKFTQHPDLKAKLLATGDAILIEGNTWHDTYWGKCRCIDCGGKGDNILGNLLMHLRTQLAADDKL